MIYKKIAYIVSEYPAVSHTFISREVQLLRKSGYQVDCFSSNKTNHVFKKGSFEFDEIKTTLFLKNFKFKLFKYILIYMLKSLFSFFSYKYYGMILKGNIKYLSYLYQAFLFSHYIKTNKIEHIHVHFANSTALVALIASKLTGVKWSISIHGPDCFENVDKHHLKEIIESCNAIRTISNFAKYQILRHANQNISSKITIIRCGVEVKKIVLKQKHKNLQGLTVGRLVTAKGQAFLLEALSECIHLGYQINWTFIGNGDQYEYLKRFSKELGIEKYINFMGARDQSVVKRKLIAADIFALTSFAEGIPVSLMEAMSKKVIVISSKTNGIPELIEHKINGYLCAPGNVNEIKDCLIELIKKEKFIDQEQSYLNSVKKKAYKKVNEEYEINKNGYKMVEFFDALLS